MNGAVPPITFRAFMALVGANVGLLLTALSGGETVRMVGWLVNGELEMACNELLWSDWRYWTSLED
jgi:hypothetical protein